MLLMVKGTNIIEMLIPIILIGIGFYLYKLYKLPKEDRQELLFRNGLKVLILGIVCFALSQTIHFDNSKDSKLMYNILMYGGIAMSLLGAALTIDNLPKKQ